MRPQSELVDLKSYRKGRPQTHTLHKNRDIGEATNLKLSSPLTGRQSKSLNVIQLLSLHSGRAMVQRFQGKFPVLEIYHEFSLVVIDVFMCLLTWVPGNIILISYVSESEINQDWKSEDKETCGFQKFPEPSRTSSFKEYLYSTSFFSQRWGELWEERFLEAQASRIHDSKSLSPSK